MRSAWQTAFLALPLCALAASSSGVSADVEASDMDGCYVLDGVPILALRAGKVHAPDRAAPVADVRYERVASGSFVRVDPEARIGPRGELQSRAGGPSRLVPLEWERFLGGSRQVRLLFPKADGIDFHVFYKHPEGGC